MKCPTLDEVAFFDCGTARYTAWPTSFRNIFTVPFEEGPIALLGPSARSFFDINTMHDFFESTKDDVIRREFAKGIIFTAESEDQLPEDSRELLKSWGNVWMKVGLTDSRLPPGPYFYKDNALWNVARLYDDTQGAFVIAVQPKGMSYQILNDGKHSWYGNSLAVPSRLTCQPSEQQPFAGYRVALKDALDLEGLQTSLCNKAYLQLYPATTATATAIVNIIQGGAFIVGKTKLSSFLSREEATESIDFQTAWNPRADGYQTPGGSSSGSAAAVAAYDWIDIGIGTDTNGSIRRPAQCNGVFGLRASQGRFSQDGMFTVFKRFDVPGIFARDLTKLASFANEWYGVGSPGTDVDVSGLPKSIIVLTDLMTEDTAQGQIVLNFVQDMEAHLGVKAERISVSDRWNQNPPVEAIRQGLHDFLATVGKDAFFYANYHSATSFREGYVERFGKKPFVSPFVQWRWDVGRTVTKEAYVEATRRMDIYKQWFLDAVMQSDIRNALVIMQSEDVSPKYRDDPPPPYYIQPAWHQWWISSILGAPELVIPAGQIAYESRISGNTEYLPVTAQILGQPGTDLDLVATAQLFLADVGRPLVVETGRSMSTKEV